MMRVFNLEGTDETPKIILDKEKGIFEISGRSMPEDAVEFYQPVLGWIDQYKLDQNEVTVFNFKLEYFNTASSKLILDILIALRGLKDLKILWYFRADDEDTQKAGEEMAEFLNIDFEFMEY